MGTLDVCGMVDYSITVTWTATDACANSTEATQTIDITVDSGAPMATAPGDVTVECGANIPAVPAVVFTDDCGTVVVDFSEVQLDSEFDNEYELLRTWIGTDVCGNVTTITQTITVEDTTPPTIVCPGTQMVDANVNCDFVLVDYTSAAVTSDNCDITGVTQSPAPGVIITTGTTTVTLVVTDDAGNSTACMFDVIANDSTDPIALCLDITIDLDATGNATIAPADINNGSSDNCTDAAALVLAASQTDFTCADLGNNVVTLTVTDMAGNSATCQANVVVTGDIVVPIENATLTECPNVPEQDVATFDITEAMVDVDGGNTVTYYNSLLGAQNAVASDEITNPTAFDSQTKTVYARVENSSGCFNIASIWLIVNDSPDPDPLPWFKFCEADLPLPIDGNPVGGSGVYVTHIWGGPDVAILDPTTTDTSTPSVLAGTEPGIYKVDYMVTDDAGCISELTFINIQIFDSPIIEACTTTPTVCIGDVINLSSETIDGTPPFTFEWTELVTGFTSTSANVDITSSNAAYPTVAGLYTYTVVVTDDNGCTDMSSVDIQFNEAPIAIPADDVTNAIFCSSSKAMGSAPIKPVDFSTSTLRADISNACANVTLGGGPLCSGIDIPASTVRWYENATGGSALFDADNDNNDVNESDADGDPSTFDPIAAGLVDGNVPGVYTFYVEAICANTTFCTAAPRTPVTLTVLDCAINDGCTYLLVLEDTGANGWDGASIDVTIDESANSTEYKLTSTECDLKVIPLSTNDGGSLDFKYWSGANENEHRWYVLDPLGNIAVDINGNAVDYGPFPLENVTITVKLDCPTNCVETDEYYIVNTIGSSPAGQVWELRDAEGEILAFNAFEDYNGLPQGSIVIDTIELESCADYNFVTFDATGNVWNNAQWQIISTNADRGTLIPFGQFNGNYEILSGPGVSFVDELNTNFTVPCPPEDCPADELAVTADIANCVLSGYVHPAPPTPFICYPNCGHGSTAPAVTISYPEINVVNQAVSTPITLPVGTNPVVFEITYTDGQIIRCSSVVNVVTDINPVITCNDHLNVPLGNANLNSTDDCFRTIEPDELLEAIIGCPGQYNVIVFDTLGARLSPPNVVGPDQVGLTLTYKVEHIGSAVHCYGTITVEDKVAPVIECADYVIECTHPDLMDENYSHIENYSAIGLPANISGSVGSSVTTTIDVGCTPIGEVIQGITLDVVNNHNRVADLSLTLTAPSGKTVTTGIPVIPDALEIFLGDAFTTASGTWDVQIVDNNGVEINGNLGGQGSIFEINLDIQAGFIRPVVVVDCSEVEFSVLSEVIVETDCDQGEWLGANLLRTWQAIDVMGNASTCVQEIGLRAPRMEDIDLPGDITLTCGEVTTDPAGILTDLTGDPTFGCYPITDSQYGLCDISLTYEDDVVAICGNSFRITRTWTITNWCAGIFTTHDQVIVIGDTDGPVVDISNIQYSTGSTECATSNVFLAPAVSDICSDVETIIATYTTGGGMYDAAGTLFIQDITNGDFINGLPLGFTQVFLAATDACGNLTEVLVDVNVSDHTAPVAVCGDGLNVSLNSAGTAQLLATDINEGSSDNCGIATIKARRVDGCIDTTNWSDIVPFECCDVDQLITVELLVTDFAGNTNICWKTVLVEDPVGPQIICEDDLTVNCEDALHAGDLFTLPTGADNCEFTISEGEVTEVDLPNCGSLLRKTYTVSDNSAKSNDATCTQTITVVHVSDFIVQFPADVIIDTCPEDLGNIPGPIVTEDDCENIGISSIDKIFVQVDDACYKIERTYTIVNHCIVSDPSASGFTDLGTPLPIPRTFRDDDGYFQYTQIIKVQDNEAPSLSFTAPDPCDFTQGCQGEQILTATGEDACSDIAALEFSWKIDAFADGTFDLEGDGADATGTLPYGNHIIKWVVTDGCGNATAEEFPFAVRDCKNPTPTCRELTTVVMNDGNCTQVLASHLLLNAEDNCTERTDEEWKENARIRRVGDNGALTTALDLCCEDVLAGGAVDIEVWVEDEAGNADFCVVTIDIQDNGNNCPDGGTGSSLMIAGKVATEVGFIVEGVQVAANNNTTVSDDNGEYDIMLPTDINYTITPSKMDDYFTGITTFDLVLMARHVLQMNILDSPYKLIAADINNDGKINVFDMVELRQLILYQVEEFQSNTPWKFVDANYVFQNPTSPWAEDYPEFIELMLDENRMQEDFIAVKIGDVSGDAEKPNLLSVESRNFPTTLVMLIDDTALKAGSINKVDFKASDFKDITGYQFTMEFDQNLLALESFEPGALDISAENFGLTMADEGILTTSFNEFGKAISVEDDEVLFSINFVAKADASLSDVLRLVDQYTLAEAYNEAYDVSDVALEFNIDGTWSSSDTPFELFQNKPNPFTDKTRIGFNLPESMEASISIYDLTGKLVYSITDQFERGYTEITLERSEIKTSGTLYYQFKSDQFTAERKMIIID